MIGLLTAFFGAVTFVAIGAVLYRFRRRPVIWLMTARDRDRAYHVDAAAALEAAVAAERAAGNSAPVARLEAALAAHRHAVAVIAASREFAGERR